MKCGCESLNKPQHNTLTSGELMPLPIATRIIHVLTEVYLTAPKGMSQRHQSVRPVAITK